MITRHLRMNALLYLLLATLFSSCLSLEAVQQYAVESAESTEQFTEIDLTFQALCQRKRQLRDLRQSRVLRTYQDSCRLHQQADSAVIEMQNAVQEYLLALYSVSSGERIYYDLSSAKDALTNSGLVDIEANTADAYQNLLELLVTASTEAYRRRQVQQLVSRANTPLVTLINQLTLVVDESFREAIGQQKEMLYLNTRELTDSAQTFIERQQVLEHYLTEAQHYEQQLHLLDTYVAMLGAVKEGHKQLYAQRDRLHRRETVATMAFYLRKLRQLQDSFARETTE